MLDQDQMMVSTDDLRRDILRHLKLSIGKDTTHANIYDWRMSLSLALRDRVVEPWFSSTMPSAPILHRIAGF